MKTYTAACSKKGLRDIQQDRYAHIQTDEKSLLVVADGNGGPGGEICAETAVKSVIAEAYYNLSHGIDSEDIGIEILNKAAEQVMQVKSLNEEWAGAGTTITLVIAQNCKVSCYWVGDSPCYVYESGNLRKLTSPVHTLAEMLIGKGTPRDVIERQKNLHSILTRCAGHESCEPSMKSFKVTRPCLVLTGSDGVFGFLSEHELTKIVLNRFSRNFDVEQLTREIVDQSLNYYGSDDNCTLISCMVMPHFRLARKSRNITKLIDWL